MKHVLRSSFYCLLGICLAAGACKGPVKDNETEAGVLQKSPFQPLTDSISHSTPDALPGLYFRRAELLARNNLHELASLDYKRSWDAAPDEVTGLRYAATLTIVGHTAEAGKLLLECRRRYPSNPSFSNMLGDLYQQSGKMKEALQVYDDQLRTDSTNFEAWYEKGLLLQKAKDTAGALLALRKAYSLQPITTYALELAHLYAESGNNEALALADEVLRKDLNHELVDPIFIKGIYYSNTGLYTKAIVQFDSCIARDWKFTDAYLEKGIALFHQKKYEEALGIFQLSIRVSNTYPDGYYWIGRCYEASAHKEEALIFYQRALALDKDFTEAADGIKRLK